MSSIFSTELAYAREMHQVHEGVIRVLGRQEPSLNYIVGRLDVQNFYPDNRLQAPTATIRRFVPAFSDTDVFTREVVNRLQSYGQLKPADLIKYRQKVISEGRIEAVIFLPGWFLDPAIYDVYNFAQDSGRMVYALENPRHQWLMI